MIILSTLAESIKSAATLILADDEKTPEEFFKRIFLFDTETIVPEKLGVDDSPWNKVTPETKDAGTVGLPTKIIAPEVLSSVASGPTSNLICLESLSTFVNIVVPEEGLTKLYVLSDRLLFN